MDPGLFGGQIRIRFLSKVGSGTATRGHIQIHQILVNLPLAILSDHENPQNLILDSLNSQRLDNSLHLLFRS